MPHDGDYLLEVFSISPMLQEVEIDRPRVQLLIPWEQLTRYTEHSTGSIGIIQVLSVSSEINYLSYSTQVIVGIQGHLKAQTKDAQQYHYVASQLLLSLGGTSIISSLTLPTLINLHVQSLDTSLVDNLIDVTLVRNAS